MAYLFLFSKRLINVDSGAKFGYQKDLETMKCIKDLNYNKHLYLWMSITSDCIPTLTENMWRKRIICIETAEFHKCFKKNKQLIDSDKKWKS